MRKKIFTGFFISGSSEDPLVSLAKIIAPGFDPSNRNGETSDYILINTTTDNDLITFLSYKLLISM